MAFGEATANLSPLNSQIGAQKTSSTISRGDELYTRKALEKCLAEDPGTLLQFAAAKEFTGENILFLCYVRDWKAAWMNLIQSKSSLEEGDDPDPASDTRKVRLYFFKIAVEIYVACVNMKTAQFPINIESKIYSNLTDIFGQAADTIMTRRQSLSSIYRMTPDYTKLGSFVQLSQLTPPQLVSSKNPSSVVVVDDDIHSLSRDFYRSQSIMHIDPRISDDVVIPDTFNRYCFDDAANSVKSLVYTNTWPKFVDYTYDVMSIKSR